MGKSCFIASGFMFLYGWYNGYNYSDVGVSIVKMNLLEGFFIVVQENLIFEVKGILHPEGRTIAYLRYIPDSDSDPDLLDAISYRKVYPLSERQDLLEKHFQKYLWYDESRHRILQSVRNTDIKRVLNPVHDHSSFQRERSESGLYNTAIDLISFLSTHTKVDKKYFGITGSLLAGLNKSGSDIDLVLYGKDRCMKFYRKLQKMMEENCITCYTMKNVKAHSCFRWGERYGSTKVYQEIECTKNLQGFYRGREFYIRLVYSQSDITSSYEDFIIQPFGEVSLFAYVNNDENGIYTPAVYAVSSKDDPRLLRVISYRGRFTEHVKSGNHIFVKGRLEKVSNNITGEVFHQIVLGESESDMMLEVDKYQRFLDELD